MGGHRKREEEDSINGTQKYGEGDMNRETQWCLGVGEGTYPWPTKLSISGHPQGLRVTGSRVRYPVLCLLSVHCTNTESSTLRGVLRAMGDGGHCGLSPAPRNSLFTPLP